MTTALPATDPLVDLDVLVRDLADVCGSPLALSEPAVGQATLALSQATAELARVTLTAFGLRRTPLDLQETMIAAREAIERARAAVARSRAARARVPASVARRAGTPAPEQALERAWTSTREVGLTCPACAASFHLRFRYRFMEGLAVRELRCPWPDCGGVVAFHLPVNSFDVSVRR